MALKKDGRGTRSLPVCVQVASCFNSISQRPSSLIVTSGWMCSRDGNGDVADSSGGRGLAGLTQHFSCCVNRETAMLEAFCGRACLLL